MAFVYTLPQERIAKRPVVPYDQAKLLIVNRRNGEIGESVFADLPNFLNASDKLIFNRTFVRKARFLIVDDRGREIEILLLRRRGDGSWLGSGRPLKALLAGSRLPIAEGVFVEILQRSSPREIVIRFQADNLTEDQIIDRFGLMPIPPYIRGGKADQFDESDYQTPFSALSGESSSGSSAAPTASLHFTPALLESLAQAGISFDYITLDLGQYSFVEAENFINASTVGVEEYLFDPKLLLRLEKWRENTGKIIAVGTSVVRALESGSLFKLGGLEATNFPEQIASRQPTDLFISKGFNFRMVDKLITNFHMPGSTHLLLVEAFLGEELLEKSYRYALENNFRFLSYGDGMLIV
ncbi:MAG TPA: S-adenosylmethionine:tRNA ribosyltransferase-isomerase [Oligoflexia bacterium]|nr:S-adenosylmethionine:tRNA ribosyltransferase-isomerase [Oligoflexia bacterium]HMP26533.1 S-adenosylmethionine:tRNA ribosyltransferase-isomerase [Oligoflexia bacterium]